MPEPMTRLTMSSVSPLRRCEQEFIMASLENPEATVTPHHQMEPMPGKPQTAEAVLYRPLRPLQLFVTLMGVGPQVHDPTTGEFHLTWRTLGSVHTLFTAGYMIVMSAMTTFSLLRYLVVSIEDQDYKSIKIIGVVMVSGYQLNALVQVLNTVYAGQRLCRLLNSWNRLAKMDIKPAKGLYLRSCVQVTFMLAFMVAMLVLTLMGQPMLLIHIMDGLVEWMFLVPRTWLTHSTVSTKVLHS